MTSFVDSLLLKLRQLLRAAWNNNGNTFTECFCELLRDMYAYQAVSFFLCCSVMVAVCVCVCVYVHRLWWWQRLFLFCCSAFDADGLTHLERLLVYELQ